jgi:hypothetical protein
VSGDSGMVVTAVTVVTVTLDDLHYFAAAREREAELLQIACSSMGISLKSFQLLHSFHL